MSWYGCSSKFINCVCTYVYVYKTVLSNEYVPVPVKSSNQVSNVIGENDTVLAHVPVVSQHAHGNMSWDFRQLPQDVVKCPAISKICFTNEGGLQFQSTPVQHHIHRILI